MNIYDTQIINVEENETEQIRLDIVYDEDPMNPRTELENLGTMVCFHNSYSLGDKHNFKQSHYSNWEELKEDIYNQGAVIVLSLYLYDHSGITISTSPFSCPWDSGQIGFIYVTRKQILDLFGAKKLTKKLKEKAAEYLLSEVETYDQYLTGDAYGFKLPLVDTNGDEIEELDSCWGYFGKEGRNDIISEQVTAAKEYLKKRESEKYTRARIELETAGQLSMFQEA